MSFFVQKIKYWLPPSLIALFLLIGFVAIRGSLPEAPSVIDPNTANTEENKPRKNFATPPEPVSDLIVDQSALATCQSLDSNEQMREKCEEALHYSAIVQSASQDDCVMIKSLTLRQLCYDKITLALAIKEGEIDTCKTIEDLALKENCTDQIQSQIAKNAKTKEACDEISSSALKQQCLSRFYTAEASTNLSSNECNKISDPQARDECREVVENNIKVAEESTLAAKTKKSINSNLELLSLCEKLGNQREADCKNAIYPRLAFENKDIEECNKISDLALANQCIETQGQAINEYYLRNSIAENNKALCNQITNGDIKNLCLSS